MHIITVTDVFNAPDEVKSLKDLPKDFRSTIKDYAKSIKANSDYTAWLDGLRESADIQINDMPANVPYNIDLTKYQEEEASGEAAESEPTDSATAESADETETSDAAADEASASSESADAASSSSAETASSEASASSESAAS